MSAIDDVLGKSSTADKAGDESVSRWKGSGKIDLDALLEKQREHHRSIQPVEVDVMLGEQPVKLFIPFVFPDEFSELADRHAPRRSVAADIPLWFDLNGVTGAYPGITAMVDGDTDDLYRVRDQEAVYGWPDLYKALSPEDQQNARMAVWALHIWEPEQRRIAAFAKNEEANRG